MARFKYTMVFTYFSGITDANSTPVRIGGFSESYYAQTYTEAAEADFRTLIQRRLAICPRGMHVSRFRIQQIEPEGPSLLRRVTYAAPNTWLSGVPQKALKVPFAAVAARPQTLREFRGIPDVQFTTGEYTPTAPFSAALTAFLAELGNGFWGQLRRDDSVTQFEVLSISAGGVVVMRQPTVGIGIGSQVQVMRTVHPQTGRRFGYFARVTAFVDASNFTISAPGLVASGFGKLRLAATTLTTFINPQTAAAEAVVRKIGRPFRAYSGRASRRR